MLRPSTNFLPAKIHKISDMQAKKKKNRGLFSPVAAKQRSNPLPVKARDVLTFDELGTFGFACVGVGAVAKAQFVHLADHFPDTVGGFHATLRQQSQMADLSPDKQHGAGILASRHAGTASDARGCIHGHVGGMFRDGNHIGIGNAARGGTDVASRLDDFVEGRAVDNQVADDGERLGAPRLNPNLVAVAELAHVKLTSGHAIIIAVWPTVDVEAAHAADAFATVVVEADRMGDAVVDEVFVQDVEHLKERAVGRDAVYGIGLEMALGTGVFLSPDMECEVHSYQLSVVQFMDCFALLAMTLTVTRAVIARRNDDAIHTQLFVISVRDLNMFINKRFLFHRLGLAVAVVFPCSDIHEVFVVAKGFAVFGLMFGAEMAAA